MTVTALAKHLKVSRRKLERHFALALDVTPSGASMKIRLAHVELLLTRSIRSIIQVAQDTGFADVSHLIRIFRSIHGTTSEVWRKSHSLPACPTGIYPHGLILRHSAVLFQRAFKKAPLEGGAIFVAGLSS